MPTTAPCVARQCFALQRGADGGGTTVPAICRQIGHALADEVPAPSTRRPSAMKVGNEYADHCRTNRQRCRHFAQAPRMHEPDVNALDGSRTR